MGLLGKIRLLLTLSSIIGIALLAFYAKDLLGVGVEDYSFEGIGPIDSSGFNVQIKFAVANPSKIDLSIEKIEYEAVLRDSGETVARGVLNGVSIPAGQTTDVVIRPRIDWVPGSNFLIQYASEDQVWMDIKLKVKIVEFLPEVPVSIPVDIKEVFGNRGSPGRGNAPIVNETGEGLVGLL